ncbi:IMP dehydrogenase, partial [Singulisphaera rosea]
MQDRIAYQGITFDDVLLEPGYSELLPRQVDTKTHLTAKIALNIPILSAPMDTVTEAELAIALAQEGGLGVIHKNMSIEEQTREVDKVKRSENGIIVDPITLPPSATVGQAREIMRGHNISGVPITAGGKLRGILTRRDLRFLESNDLQIEEVMTKENLVTAPADTSLEEADRILTYKVVQLQEGDNALSWTVDGPQFPNFTLAASRMAETKFDEARLDVRVERDLRVSVKPTKEAVGPGDEIEVEVSTEDQLGKPVSAEVSLAMVDRSLLRLFNDTLPPITSFFYDQTRTGAFATQSSNTFKYTPTTTPVSDAVVEENERANAVAANEAARLGAIEKAQDQVMPQA